MLKIKPKKELPLRVMIYGSTGLGKSTFAAEAPNPIFFSVEGGASHLNVTEADGLTSWEAVDRAVDELIKDRQGFETLVIDSADWLERLAHTKVIGPTGTDIVTAGKGYGSGYATSREMHKKLIDKLDVLHALGMGIVLTAHSTVKTVKDPSESSDYNHFQPAMHDAVSQLWMEWVDVLLFLKVKTFVKGKKAIGDGTVQAFASQTPMFLAKNRIGLPAEFDFVQGQVWPMFENKKIDLKKEILESILKIENEETRSKAIVALEKAGEDKQKLGAILARVNLVKGK